jgi:hypothetical protein
MVRPNWSAIAVLLVSLGAWGALADAGYRVAHHGRGDLGRALEAKATRIAHRIERAV